MMRKHGIALVALLVCSLALGLEEADEAPIFGAPDEETAAAAEEEVDAVLEESWPAVRDCTLAGLRQSLLARFDANGDGELDATERYELAQLRRRYQARRAWTYDHDNSGDLNQEELQRLRSDLLLQCENRRARLLSRFDADGDGGLDETEWSAADAAELEQSRARRRAVLDRYDTDGDGSLSPSERRVFVAFVHGYIRGTRHTIQAAHDTDGSRDLSAQELAALRQTLRAQLRGEEGVSAGDEPPLGDDVALPDLIDETIEHQSPSVEPPEADEILEQE